MRYYDRTQDGSMTEIPNASLDTARLQLVVSPFKAA